MPCLAVQGGGGGACAHINKIASEHARIPVANTVTDLTDSLTGAGRWEGVKRDAGKVGKGVMHHQA